MTTALLAAVAVILGGLDIHEATATTLFVFLFTGVLGTWLFYRRGHVYWRIVIPVCIGSVAFSYLGALVNAMVESRLLTIIIAAVIIFSGAWLLLPARRAEG